MGKAEIFYGIAFGGIVDNSLPNSLPFSDNGAGAGTQATATGTT